uniref:Uncharacterized protein n=1 Tax=Glossina pallidipes TaxID=7398 RepID=A0A1A9ZE05_GLOPL
MRKRCKDRWAWTTVREVETKRKIDEYEVLNYNTHVGIFCSVYNEVPMASTIGRKISIKKFRNILSYIDLPVERNYEKKSCKIPPPTKLSQIFITPSRVEGEDPGGENGIQPEDEFREGDEPP